MFQKITIQGARGTLERPGYFQEVIIVREGDEKPLALARAATCLIGPHHLEKGLLAHLLPDGTIICPDHISNIMTQKQYKAYYAKQSKF